MSKSNKDKSKKDIYSRYVYKRGKKQKAVKRRSVVFPLFVMVVLLISALLISNLFLGFISFGKKSEDNTASLPPLSAWVVQVGNFETKSAAQTESYNIKADGGAGFTLSSETSWLVLENAYTTAESAQSRLDVFGEGSQIKEFTTNDLEITLADKSHKTVLTQIINSFNSNFTAMNDLLTKLRGDMVTPAEITGAALEKYNDLGAALREFNSLVTSKQGTNLYSNISLAANKQLLSLYLLSSLSPSDNIAKAAATLTNTICSIYFAYYDLANSLAK